MLCHSYTVYIAKFISIAVHKKKSFFLFIKVLDSYRLNFSCHNFGTMICSSCTSFCFMLCYICIYSCNNFSCANKKVSSIQSTIHASANRQIFYTSPVSFVGLKTASIQIRSFTYYCYLFRNVKQVAKH